MCIRDSGQDVALSRLKPGFDSRWGHHFGAKYALLYFYTKNLTCGSPVWGNIKKAFLTAASDITVINSLNQTNVETKLELPKSNGTE